MKKTLRKLLTSKTNGDNIRESPQDIADFYDTKQDLEN